MNKLLFISLFLFIVSMSFVGCGSIDSQTDIGGKTADFGSELDGVWATNCVNLGSSSLIATLEFTDGAVNKKAFAYSDTNCIQLILTHEYQEKFSLGDKIGDVKKINLTLISHYITFTEDETVNTANNSLAYNYSNWVKNSRKEISGKTLNSNSTPERAVNTTLYDIFKLDGNKLILGDKNSSLDGLTEQKRPSTLDDGIVFTKQ